MPLMFDGVEYCIYDKGSAYTLKGNCVDQKRSKHCPIKCPYKFNVKKIVK